MSTVFSGDNPAIGNPDDALWVKFDLKPVRNEFRSKQEGHPCFDDKVFISIVAPADQFNKIDRPATEADKERFPRQWLNFQRGNADKVDGMPIEEWAVLTRSQSEEFKFMGIRSVEQLAAASDNQMQKLMAGPSFREKAKAFLARAKDDAVTQKFADENSALKLEIASLKAQIQAISDKVTGDKVESSQASAIPRRRGRPPKVRPEA